MKRSLRILSAFLLLNLMTLLLHGCNGFSGTAWRYDPGIPAQVTDVKAESGNRVVTLTWTPNTIARSYNIYYVSGLSADHVTRANATKVTAGTTPQTIEGLDNNIPYHFMITAQNRDGESVDSAEITVTPGPFIDADLTGVWYFHTLVTGPGARWERGTMTVAANGEATVSEFQDSANHTDPPPGFSLSIAGTGALTQSGAGAWVDFHGVMGARKKLMSVTWSPSLQSRALTIFQKKKDDSDPEYTIQDISGTGSGQNPNNPNLLGNGPTRFAYHQLYSGATTEWEYSNAKVGQHGNIWLEQYKDIIYWDFSTPVSKTANYDYLWKVTSVGIDADGLVTEYWNFENVADPVLIPSFNTLVPKQPHDTVFTGRMTADRTVVIGVATTTDANGNNPRYFLRIMQLCFKPTDQTLTDQTLPQEGINNLAGTYHFQKLASTVPAAGADATASWAYGSMAIDATGETSFPAYADSYGNTQSGDTFTLAYYLDPNPDQKNYTDFANFVSPVQDGNSRYFDAGGTPLRRYYDFASFGSLIGAPSTWRTEDTSTKYYNEHATLSYTKDMVVMTRTDSSGYAMVVGLK